MSFTAYKADLLVSFGHPLVPAVEHLQPFCLPLSQHLSWDLFSTVEEETIKLIEVNKLFSALTDNGFTLLCHVQ